MNTNINLSSLFSSEETFANFVDMMNDMDLELLDISLA